MDPSRPILILGLGNPLQEDDGVGCRVIQALEREPLPENVRVMDGGTPGIGLVHLLEGWEQVIIIDAADMDQAPGTIRQFSPEALRQTAADMPMSLHRSGVADTLALARALDLVLPEISFFGVQPMYVGWGEQLSAPVQDAVPQLLAAVREAVRGPGSGGNTRVPGAEHGK